MMKTSHMNPQEAVCAFNDLQAKIFIPMHYGTYDLADEPLGEPIKLLQRLESGNKIKGKLCTLMAGENYFMM